MVSVDRFSSVHSQTRAMVTKVNLQGPPHCLPEHRRRHASPTPQGWTPQHAGRRSHSCCAGSPRWSRRCRRQCREDAACPAGLRPARSSSCSCLRPDSTSTVRPDHDATASAGVRCSSSSPSSQLLTILNRCQTLSSLNKLAAASSSSRSSRSNTRWLQYQQVQPVPTQPPTSRSIEPLRAEGRRS